MPELFVVVAYSSHLNSVTGKLPDSYIALNESMFSGLEDHGIRVNNILKENDYHLDQTDSSILPKEMKLFDKSDGMLEVVEENASAGSDWFLSRAQTLGRTIMLAHTPELVLTGRRKALVDEKWAHDLKGAPPFREGHYDQIKRYLAQ